MDDAGQIWKWADVGSSQMPREAPAYPTLTGGAGDDQPAVPSRINHLQLFTWITDHLAWLSQYDTVYVFVDIRELPGTNCPDHWPYFAPWIKGRCEVIGYRQEGVTLLKKDESIIPRKKLLGIANKVLDFKLSCGERISSANSH